MLLSTLKSDFQSRLFPIYPKKEIDSIFDLVVEYLLNYSKIDIRKNLRKNILPETERQMLKILEQLCTAEPIQYVLGKTEFYGLIFATDNRALIPRQETEVLVHKIVEDNSHVPVKNILDIGTGCGCIAIALAKSFPESSITAIDNSREALELASANAQTNATKINFIHDDIIDPEVFYDSFDIIVSNPPYVRHSEKKFIHRNVLEFEPVQALFVPNDDPLLYFRAIADFGKDHLHPGGKIYLELNEFLGKETEKLFEQSGYCNIKLLRDLNQKYRYLIAGK